MSYAMCGQLFDMIHDRIRYCTECSLPVAICLILAKVSSHLTSVYSSSLVAIHQLIVLSANKRGKRYFCCCCAAEMSAHSQSGWHEDATD